MKDAFADLFASKKFIVAIVSVIAWAVGHIGLELTAEQLAPIVGPLWLFIVGQAFADHGKEAAKVEAESLPLLLDDDEDDDGAPITVLR